VVGEEKERTKVRTIFFYLISVFYFAKEPVNSNIIDRDRENG
jgi:hypothetical protein